MRLGKSTALYATLLAGSKFLEGTKMSKPTVRVQRQSGVQGLEKKLALQASHEYCKNHGLSEDKLRKQLLHFIDDAAIFAAPSNVEPDGLRNDIATQPLPVLIIEVRDGTLVFRQTEYTQKYLA